MAKTSVYEERRGRVYDLMAREGAALLMFEDAEGARDSNIRWLCGMPADALLFLSAERKALLVPWDINLAKLYASADYLRPYTDFERLPVRACKNAAEFFGIAAGAKIEIPPGTAHPRFLEYAEAFAGFDILCGNGGLVPKIEKLRAIKDDLEIAIYRKAAAITNDLLDALQARLRAGTIASELDAALFIDAESRRRGCEGTGFETLAAGPARSFAIHAFPAYSGECFGGAGLSILDFGLKYDGYTTDVTLTVARDLSSAQEEFTRLVEQAAELAVSRVRPGVLARDIAAPVDALFASAGHAMPHGLGHGIGLDAHEAPAIRNRAGNDWVLEPGMVITLEPGLYHPLHGGCRLENDLLVTQNGVEILTTSRIIRL